MTAVPARHLAPSALTLLVGACGVHYERTGIAPLPAGPGIELAVVQVYESLPLHYYGLRHTLACRSPQTAAKAANRSDGLDPGWVAVGQLPGVPGHRPGRAVREKGLADAAAAAAAALAAGDGWIAWRKRVLRVSVDSCSSFAEFVPWRSLPPGDIEPAPRPDFCRPEVDCRHFDFEGGREASFPEITVQRLPGEPAKWRIGAVVRSAALRDGRARRVTSDDLGATWRVESAGP